MLFLEYANVCPTLGQVDIAALAQPRTDGWISIRMFTGKVSEWISAQNHLVTNAV